MKFPLLNGDASLPLPPELEDQKKIIIYQFKEKIKDCHLIDTSDRYLLKWLKARNYNVEQAEKMLRQSVEWRRLNKVDSIVDSNWQPPEVITKYFSFGLCGVDKFNCPLYFTQQGLIDIRGIFQSTTKRDLLHYFVYMMETIGREQRACNRDGSLSVIADMEHMQMYQQTYLPVNEVRNELAKIYESNYPETLRKMFIINAPRLFTIIFNMIKPFLHQATIDKIRIFGCDKEEWKAALLQEVDADQLPAFLGGTLTDADGDPMCPSRFSMGGEVPKSYYFSNSKPMRKENMSTINIPNGTKKKLEFDVTAVDSVLRWEFLTEGGDVGFHVYFHRYDQENDILDLVAPDRIPSHLVIEEGQIICDSPGKYIIEFDNTFSYFHSKKVHYLITIDLPTPN